MDACFFWASWDFHSHVVPQVAAALNRPIAGMPDVGHAESVKQRLRQAGIKVKQGAEIRLTESVMQLFSDSPWSQEIDVQNLHAPAGGHAQLQPGEAYSNISCGPPSCTKSRAHDKLAARLFRSLEGIKAANLWHKATPEDQTSMLTAGGHGVGTTWQAIPRSSDDFLPSRHWTMATLMRLNAVKPPQEAQCCLPTNGKRGDEETIMCGVNLSEDPHHPESCKAGGGNTENAQVTSPGNSPYAKSCRGSSRQGTSRTTSL